MDADHHNLDPCCKNECTDGRQNGGYGDMYGTGGAVLTVEALTLHALTVRGEQGTMMLEELGKLRSYLVSTGTDAFLIAGALPPLRPLPFGISLVASFVRLGVHLTFLSDKTSCVSCSLCRAAATTWEHRLADLYCGQSSSQAMPPFFLGSTK